MAGRSSVLAFIRDHVEAGETDCLDAAALEFGELLPAMPEWLAQDEYEERTAVGSRLLRLTKSVDGLVMTMNDWPRGYALPLCADSAPSPEDLIEKTDEFITTRVDTGGGPEVIAIQRK